MTTTRLRIAIAALACVVVAAGALGSPASAKHHKSKDIDHDGLPTKWENGKTKRGLKLHALGANAKHRDIFVELDYSSAAVRSSIQCGSLNQITAAFAKAPLTNPDHRKGIKLHIDAGKNCPGHKYDLGASKLFNAGACPNTTQILNIDQLHEKFLGAFHIAGVAPAACGGGEGGSATLGGVTMAIYTDGDIAHVLMHELGHNLGLNHGAHPVPNRLSVMNGTMHTSTDGFGDTPIVDYQRFPIPALDENHLVETDALQTSKAHDFYVNWYCPGPSFENGWVGDGGLDWNCNHPPPYVPPQVFDPGEVSADINGDGQLTVLPATPAEWPLLKLRSRTIGK